MAQEEKYSLKDKFAAAVKVIQSLPDEGPFQPSDDMMLMFYSYYKQATLGPCNIPRPTGFWDTRGKAEWDAWSSLGNMTKEEAKMNYVEAIQLILETIPISDEVSELVQKLGNFYAEVEGEENEENEVDKKPFTRPFAKNADKLSKPFQKPVMEGYGDLWDDIQNLPEKGKQSSALGVAVSSMESKVNMERKEETCDLNTSEEEENGDEEDNTEDEEEEDKEWSPDPSLLTVKDRRWRSGMRGSSSSVEPSMSIINNGTHSSLNSEVEEEELACSIEANSYFRHFNRQLSDPSETVPDKNYRSTDSDNEEFCDSMEHLAMEEVLSTSKVQSSRAALGRQKDLWFEDSTSLNGGEDQILIEGPHFEDTAQHNSTLSRRGRGSQLCVDTEAACFCASQRGHSVSAAHRNINEQVAAVLLRLQDDMANMLHRLHALESRSCSPRQEDSFPITRKFLKPSWWPFHFSPLTVAFTALWPLIAHWLMHLYLQWRRRKIS
ncbi:hypothetical protein LDENG_00134330 [Lucifuga dentata]|nr:hypothetical protein LDENG_00134330 [Lucifuga dentata]